MTFEGIDEYVAKAVEASGKIGGDIRINCVCQDGQSQDESMGVNTFTGVYHCFRCNQKGNYLKKNKPEKKIRAEFIWSNTRIEKSHPYVTQKQIRPNEIRVDKYGNWVIPFENCNGQLQTVQFITLDSKKFLSKVKNNNQGVKGAAYKINGNKELSYVCEGPATGHSIHESTGAMVYCVGGKENFKNVLPWVKGKHKAVVVAADNDKRGDGLKAANKAAVENGLKIVIPPTVGEDFNDYAIAAGLDAAKTVLKDPKEPEQSPAGNDDEFTKAMTEINSNHAAVLVGTKFQILREIINPLTKKPDILFLSAFDFKLLYANKTIQKTVPNGNGGETKRRVQIADEWIKYEGRREYNGLVFDPSEKKPSDYYNLWAGFAYKPIEGKWNLFESHILNVIANGDREIYYWILAWMARIIQDPGGEKPGTAIVMRGKQGTGKGIFVNSFGKLLGKHFLQVAHASQVTGRFNSHFKDALFVFVDEGFWAGDKQAEGVIKNLITEPFLTIEQKGKDIIKVENHVNMMIATNNVWAVPAGLEERRFFVIDVSDKHKQDHQYFKAIVDQMKNGGTEAMLYDLLNMDISQINLRVFKQTIGLFEQKVYSMSIFERFWFERLKEGVLVPLKTDEKEQYNDAGWREISRKRFHKIYLAFAETNKERYPMTLTQFGIALRKMCRNIGTSRLNEDNSRPWGYKFPPLKECREEFEKITNSQINWDDGPGF